MAIQSWMHCCLSLSWISAAVCMAPEGLAGVGRPFDGFGGRRLKVLLVPPLLKASWRCLGLGYWPALLSVGGL